jgi:branched-chain amino acid transport system substrate-binding protein
MVAAQTLEQVLKQCENDLTRANVMKQAASLKDFAPGLLQPGVKINTGPDDFFLFDSLTLAKFNGTTYEPLSD